MTSQISWFSFNPTQQTLNLGLLGSLGVIVFDKASDKIFRSCYFKNEIYVQKELKDLSFTLKKGTQFQFCFRLTSLIFLRPLAEEIIFRGMVREQAIDYQKKRGQDPDTTISQLSRSLFNAGLFSLLHLKPLEGLRHNLRLGIPIFFSGLIYSGLTEVSGTIWPATLAHTINNGYSISRFLRGKK